MNTSINDGFSLIWIYWYRKYIATRKTKKSISLKPTKKEEIETINTLKQKYHIETIQSTTLPPNTLQLKLQQIKYKALSNSSFNSPKADPIIYTINPQLQAKQMEDIMMLKTDGSKQEKQELLNQLHSYYLNCKNIFVIYKSEQERLVIEPIMRLMNQNSTLKSNRTNSIERFGNINQFLNLEDGISLERNESLLESLDKIQNKIDGLEVLDKFAELDGLEIWNAKYLGIPHSFLKIKKHTWTKCLNRPLLHASQPQTISDLPILPRITKFRPSIDKLMSFVSFLKLLEQYAPQSSPTIDSIFQYNNMPYVFVQDRIDRGGWEQNYGVLCYYVAYGDEGNNLNENYIKRWIEQNSKTKLAGIIHQMNDRQKNRVKFINRQPVNLSLGFLFSDTDNNGCIW